MTDILLRIRNASADDGPQALLILCADAANEINRLRLAILNAHLGESTNADFENLTWTFTVSEHCKVSAGTYALVPYDVLTSIDPEVAE